MSDSADLHPMVTVETVGGLSLAPIGHASPTGRCLAPASLMSQGRQVHEKRCGVRLFAAGLIEGQIRRLDNRMPIVDRSDGPNH